MHANLDCLAAGGYISGGSARMRSSSLPMRDMRMPALNFAPRGVKTPTFSIHA